MPPSTTRSRRAGDESSRPRSGRPDGYRGRCRTIGTALAGRVERVRYSGRIHRTSRPVRRGDVPETTRPTGRPHRAGDGGRAAGSRRRRLPHRSKTRCCHSCSGAADRAGQWLRRRTGQLQGRRPARHRPPSGVGRRRARRARAGRLGGDCLRSSGAAAARSLPEAIASRVDPVALRVVEVPARYVASEESALANFLTTGDARPTATPPRPFERGINGRPTLVDNVETLAHLALINRFGVDWFRSVGTQRLPGTLLVTLGGAVNQPAVFEVAGGSSLGAVIEQAGGPSEPVQAVLVGGYAGSWLALPDARHTPMDHDALRSCGAALGVAVVLALPARACGLAQTAHLLHYLAGESARQCGPCTFGLPGIASDFVDLALGGRKRSRGPQPAPHEDRVDARQRRMRTPRRRQPPRGLRAAGLRRRPGPSRTGEAVRGRRRPAVVPHSATTLSPQGSLIIKPTDFLAPNTTLELRVNPIACDAHGLCAELLPEHVSLDEWGYPVIDRGPIRASLLPHARRVVSVCPTLALRLQNAPGPQQR